MDWGNLDEASKNGFVAVFFTVTRPNIEPVVVFFVLSGFLVGGKVLERLVHGTFCPASYALDRFSRIYIPLLPAFAFTAIVAWALGHPPGLGELLGNLLSLQNIACRNFGGNSPLWSLSYEVWFYVLAGSFAAVASASTNRRVTAMFIFALATVVYSALSPILLFCWLLGAAAYPLRTEVLPRWAIISGVCLAIGGAAMSQMNMQSRSLEVPLGWLPSRDVSLLFMGAGLAITVAWLAGKSVKSPGMAKFQAIGAALAALSYTLYLTHYPVLGAWQLVDATRYSYVTVSTVALLVLKVSSCLVVAWLLYLPFERRTGDFRKWFRARYASQEGKPAMQ